MNSDVISMLDADYDDYDGGADDDEIESELVEEEDDDGSDEDSSTDNVGETSVEINVEDLIAEIEAESGESTSATGARARKKLDELLDEKRAQRELEDFEDLEFS